MLQPAQQELVQHISAEQQLAVSGVPDQRNPPTLHQGADAWQRLRDCVCTTSVRPPACTHPPPCLQIEGEVEEEENQEF